MTRTAAASPTGGLGVRAARGAVVTIGAQLVRILIQVVSVVVLARLLTPTDYGLLCVVLGLVAWPAVFVPLYALLFVANAGFVALALPKWYREIRRMSRPAPVAGEAPSPAR